MRRVNWSALTPDADGRLRYPGGTITDPEGVRRYRGVPFSGLAYRVEDGVVESIAVVQEGVVSGVSDDWIDVPEGGLRVDADLLDEEEDYGPLLFKGAALTGAAYDFAASGACIEEVEYVDGRATETSQRAWYESGAPREVIGEGVYTSWFQDGRLQRRAEKGTLLFNLILRDDGRLGGIFVAEPGFFDVDTVRRIPFSDEVLLIGKAMDAEVLRSLHDHTGLRAVPRLRLIETSVGPTGVDLLVSFLGLVELWLVNNLALGPQDAEQIRRRRPECVVHFEAEEASPTM